LGVGVIHLTERTELVSGEMSVMVCIAVRGIQHGKNDTGTERVREQQGEDKTVNARRMLGTPPRL
jgi:hypothetical protein